MPTTGTLPRPAERAGLGWAAATLLALLFLGGPTRADTVRLLAAGAVQGAIGQLQPALGSAIGHSIEATFDTVGALRERVLAGERVDVVILSEVGIEALGKAGKVEAGSRVALGSVSVGLAIRKGAAVPDVGSPEALKRTLLAAASIAHADPARGATAGAHFAGVLQRLGIADSVRPRLAVLGFGGDVVDGVAQGRFELGVSQSSEIVAHPGVALVGPLPEPYAHRTHYLAAKVHGAGANADALLAALQTPQARAAFAAVGFEAP
jgi:molybdate transport system substrate-binding protein